MRMGAIFARGSCKALKWMALFGVVFALGAGQAAAQMVRLEGGTTLAEGGALVPVTAVVTVPAGMTTTGNFDVTLMISVDTTAATPVQEIAESEMANADVYWEGVARGILDYKFPENTFGWVMNATAVQTLRATVRMGTFRDTDAEDEKFIVTPPAGTAVNYIVDDAETQEYLLSHPLSNDNVIKEGAEPILRLEAKPPISGDVVFRINLSSDNDSNDYYLRTQSSGAATTAISEHFTVDGADDTGDSMVDVFLTSVTNDVDRIDDTINLVVLTTVATKDMPIGTQVADLELTVIDQHKLPTVAIDGLTIVVDKNDTAVSPAMTLVEGQLGTVELVADRGTTTDDVYDNEAVKVALSLADSSSADRQDYRLADVPVTIAAAAGKGGSGKFKVDVLEDEDVGEEMLVFTATITGEDAYGKVPKEMMLGAIILTDTTPKKIYPMPTDVAYPKIMAARAEAAGANGLWTAGEKMTLKAEDLFGWPETTTSVVLGNIVISDTTIVSSTTSNDMLTIEAMSPGMVEVSVTATVVSEASSFMPSQTVSNTASVKFPLTVDAHAITAMSDADVQAAADAAIAMAAEDSPRMQWEPGGSMAMVPLDELFDVPMELMVSYLAETGDADDVTAEIYGEYVALTPVSAGMAEITVTAVDTSAGMAATVMFTAMVMALDPSDITYTLTGPEDMNLAEGMSAMVTVTAGDPVPMNTEVMIMRDRAASSADDDDYMAEPIMILAGQMSGSTMVMAVEDDMAEEMEELVLYAMAGDVAVMGEVKLYLWDADAAVPALPILAQLLLAGLLGFGGYRRYLRRR